MKKILLIAIIVIGLGGFLYYQGTTSQTADPAASVPQAPSSNIGGDVNVCIGSAAYCQGLADAEKLALENANKQFELQLTAQAPVPTATPSPDDVARQLREDQNKSNVLITALWATVILGVLAGLLWMFWQLYWHFRVKVVLDEKAADIRESKDKRLIVARLPGNPDFANSADQWIALDRNALGAQLIHIDTAGIAHKLQLSDEAAKYVAIGNAMGNVASSDQARAFMTQLLDQWTRSANTTIQTLGDAASKWRGSGRGHHVPSKMTQLTKPQPADKEEKGDPGNTTTTTWQ